MPEGRNARVAVALDFESRAGVLAAASRLAPHAGFLKVGLEAFVAEGPALVRELVALPAEVFLDLKLHDIPNTVARAAAAAARTGAAILNVHAAGGREMMRAAGEAAREAAEAAGLPRPSVIAVTVLTSLDAAALGEAGFAGAPAEVARKLAGLAREAGLDGVVTSPEETAAIRADNGPGFLLVVPGIRPAGAAAGDQRRIATPAEAARAGADVLVVGRPITRADDPVAALRAILAEIGQGLGGAVPGYSTRIFS